MSRPGRPPITCEASTWRSRPPGLEASRESAIAWTDALSRASTTNTAYRARSGGGVAPPIAPPPKAWGLAGVVALGHLGQHAGQDPGAVRDRLRGHHDRVVQLGQLGAEQPLRVVVALRGSRTAPSARCWEQAEREEAVSPRAIDPGSARAYRPAWRPPSEAGTGGYHR